MFIGFIRCRRGSVGMMLSLALIPLIGLAGFGTEAGMWYAVKRHAQNAADAAAYSGAFWLANPELAPGAHTLDYRGKQFAAQNGFCGDTVSYPGSICAALPAGVTQSIVIARGNYAGGFVANAAGNSVQATVTQSQPPLLSRIWLGSGNVDIVAVAVAQVQTPKNVCAIGLEGVIINGGPTIGGSNCTIQSDTFVKLGNNVTFTGQGMALDGVTGCQSPCATPTGAAYNWFTEPATDPLATTLDLYASSMFASVSTAHPTNLPNCNDLNCALSPSMTAYGDLRVNAGGTMTLAPGTYFFYNATITVNGGATLTASGPVNIVMLGSGSRLTVNGGSGGNPGGTVNLTANLQNADFPALNGVLFYDQGTAAVNINGSSTSQFGGSLYMPNADITWSGNQQSSLTACTEVLGKTLTITGNSYLNTNRCAPGTIPKTQVVLMVM
jgi:hypothetical protein